MAKRKVNRSKFVPQHNQINTHWVATPSYQVSERRTLEPGDEIKITQVWGTRFRFVRHVYNPKTETEWIDCIELHKGQPAQQRSFRPERIKVLPKKRKKKHFCDNKKRDTIE